MGVERVTLCFLILNQELKLNRKIHMTQDVKHFSLVASEITFRSGEDVHKITLSTVFASNNKNMPVKALAECQQRLQGQLFDMWDADSAKAGIALPPIEVLNVVLLSNTSLGYMTMEEFNAPPEGMTMAEQEPMTEEQIKNMIFGVAE